MACACGPGWLPSKFLHWYLQIPEGEECFYHEACRLHDKDYEDQILSWFECDQLFFARMITLYQLTGPDINQLLRAVKYYNWVRRAGWISYYACWTKKTVQKMLQL